MTPPSPPFWTLDTAGGRAVRVAAGALALALAALTASRHFAADRHRRATYEWLAQSGVTADTAALEREDDPELMDLRAARAALSSEISARPGDARAPEAVRSALEGAARRAAKVLRARPASWEAAFVLGAATYLGRSAARDPRLFTAYRDWEAPLEAASRLAPGRRAPGRMLAGIYLDLWPALSPRKRAVTHQLVAETFTDPSDLERLLPAWLAVATDRREAFSVIPDDPASWERVQAYLGTRGDLLGYRESRLRWDRALFARLGRDLGEADRRRASGNLEVARNLYLSVATRARPERRYLDLVEQALDRCPPGPVDKETAARLAPHLDRALDRCLDAGCEIRPETLKRLSTFVRDLAPQPAALAALFAGDLAQASLIERRSSALWTEEWAPYWIAKARYLAAHGNLEQARAALLEVHHDWQRRPLYWQAQADVAVAAGDEAKAAAARAELGRLARAEWGPADWVWRQDVARLEMVAGPPAGGLEFLLADLPPSGIVLEVRLDGADLGAFAVAAAGGGQLLRVPAAIASGPHVLEISSTFGGRLLPGATRLF